MSRWLPRITSGGGGGGTPPLAGGDHFAPTYLVGNATTGDPTPDQAAPFRYIRDTGNGAGLATALSEAAVTGGIVEVRRGVYDFALAGGPVAPLVVAPNVWLKGAGPSTIIRGLDTANQGVLIMRQQARISDLDIESGDASAASLGSDAVLLVDVTDPAAVYTDLGNVNIRFSTAVGGQLRDGIRVSGVASFCFHRWRNVGVTALTATADLATRCYHHAVESLVVYENLSGNGGNIGFREASVDGGCFGRVAVFAGWNSVGIQQVTGLLRLENALVQAVPTPGAIALDMVSGSEHTFRDIEFSTSLGGLAGTRGIRIIGGGSEVNDVLFDRCFANGEIAAEIGTGGAPSATHIRFMATDLEADLVCLRVEQTTDLLVDALCNFLTPEIGIDVFSSTSVQIEDLRCITSNIGVRCDAACTDVTVDGGDYDIAPDGGPVPLGAFIMAGVRCGVRNKPRVNFTSTAVIAIVMSGPNADVESVQLRHISPGALGIDILGPASTVTDVHAEVVGVSAATTLIRIGAAAERTSIKGCVLNAIDLGGAPGILIEGDSVACTGNTVTKAVTVPASAGIIFAAGSASGTATGNTVIGSGAVTPVLDIPLANVVGFNAGA